MNHKDLHCAGCTMLLDHEGADDIGAIPPLWIDGDPYCGGACAAGKTGGIVIVSVSDAPTCDRCTRPLGSASPLAIGKRRYCGGHCLSVDQCERSDGALDLTRDRIGTRALPPRVREVSLRWGGKR